MAKSQTTKISNRDQEVTFQRHETDSPIIPVAQLEKLNEFKPDAVDWVIEQTTIEANFRREETSRVNGYIFFERILGQVCALVIGLVGIVGGSWAVLNDQPAGAVIASSAFIGLVAVFLQNRKKRD